MDIDANVLAGLSDEDFELVRQTVRSRGFDLIEKQLIGPLVAQQVRICCRTEKGAEKARGAIEAFDAIRRIPTRVKEVVPSRGTAE